MEIAACRADRLIAWKSEAPPPGGASASSACYQSAIVFARLLAALLLAGFLPALHDGSAGPEQSEARSATGRPGLGSEEARPAAARRAEARPAAGRPEAERAQSLAGSKRWKPKPRLAAGLRFSTLSTCLRGMVPISPARAWRIVGHGHRHGTAAVSPLRRSAGRSGVRFHPRRNHRVALLGARLAHSRAPASQPVPDPGDRGGRRRDDVRGGDAAVRRAGRDPGAADRRARLPLPPAADRRLGGELHRGRRRRAGRALRRGAEAAEGAGRRSGSAARRRAGDEAAFGAVRRSQSRKASSPARASGWPCAACSR